MEKFPSIQEIEALEAAWQAQRVWERIPLPRVGKEEEELITFKGPNGDLVDRDDFYNLVTYKNYRYAAQSVSAELAKLSVVSRVVLFGSVAKPLVREVFKRRHYRGPSKGIWHYCHDVDLAVWVDSMDNLRDLQHARSRGVKELLERKNIGIAHHQVELFLFTTGSNRYRGRLCTFNTCPKAGKIECIVPGCGADKFLRQHSEFQFYDHALAAEQVVELYNRGKAACHAQ